MNILKEAANNSITNIMPLPGVASLCVFIRRDYASR